MESLLDEEEEEKVMNYDEDMSDVFWKIE